MANGIDNIRFIPSGPGWSRPGVVFTTASVALLGAFLIPFSAKMLDVLWICTFCLAAATTMICYAAKSSSDLAGFVPLIFGLTLLRLVVQAGTARSIIRDEPAGVLVGLTGSAVASAWPLGAAFICLLLAVIFVVVIFASCRRITQASIAYIRRILPLKRTGIETDLRLGLIDDHQAGALAQRVVTESRFFADMNGTGMLMRAESAICIFLLLACLLLPILGGSLEQATGTQRLAITAPSVAALSLFTLIPAVVVATSCRTLVNKNSLALRAVEQGNSSGPQSKKITVVTLDADSETDADSPVENRALGPAEQIAEFEPQPTSRGSRPVSMELSCRNAREYYEKLSSLIDTIDTQPRVILLASDKVHSLPVTVAVNIAIRLAQKRCKVLLVDTDNERNAVAQVFDLPADELRKKVKSSSLENLSVCCVPAERLDKFLQKSDILKHFGATLIYTPNTASLKGARSVHADGPGAFYFMDETQPDDDKTVAEKLSFCSWLCRIPSIQSILGGKS